MLCGSRFSRNVLLCNMNFKSPEKDLLNVKCPIFLFCLSFCRLFLFIFKPSSPSFCPISFCLSPSFLIIPLCLDWLTWMKWGGMRQKRCGRWRGNERHVKERGGWQSILTWVDSFNKVFPKQLSSMSTQKQDEMPRMQLPVSWQNNLMY